MHRSHLRKKARPLAVPPLQRKPLHTMQVAKMAMGALGKGATASGDRAGLLKWNVSGRCLRPVVREVRGVPYETWGYRRKLYAHSSERFLMPIKMDKRQDGPQGVSIEVTARCRKCSECLRYRAREWANRAHSEIRASHRTWFGTLTLSPEQHHRFLSMARVRLSKGAVDYDALNPHERFVEVEREIYREVQLMLKRLRKAGHQFRSLFVCETHKTGKPHYHCLLHEVGQPIRHKQLASAWAFGFTNWKLVDTTGKGVAWYVCKYLSKSTLVQIRASLRYGQSPKTACADKDDENFSLEKLSFSSSSCDKGSQPMLKEEPDSQKPEGLLGLNSEGAEDACKCLSRDGISNACRKGESSDGLSKSTASPEASQRQSSSVDIDAGERQRSRRERDEECPPF